ncbi:MAG: hypothetical protein A2504_13955 [Bdellovibrionales bacterium RIFOXYD12_FULL_39_22]|nr:MAG: hypothetical protein A2385_00680 [Bdellovibrionales bacterium RIFOXYB1_FULL_39_21]OFZ43808.1 MAG: hypothetical protein A2485_04850 [Bdellovibrionales bacterium RIFOXYC12_FULL_39_17]OFZ48858.1 MAG: hypothetical protein A2404_17995 [Bdellovibrionales bacterium RIFOXYC1_FULL_39_130]OFZ76591.1 MAG: hypothetical protein A2560_06660 [Bdellovibrionales bacterium RIFOXYD1_FULL_39_84]OFZ94825.1 MAG: hypothetical protein A2504_13955 [Bdellovibrionales bacterium RIFOXYD12_FULL_39_22]HLE12250.1 hy
MSLLKLVVMYSFILLSNSCSSIFHSRSIASTLPDAYSCNSAVNSIISTKEVLSITDEDEASLRLRLHDDFLINNVSYDGKSVDYSAEQTWERTKDIIRRHNYLLEEANGGIVFHGASSSSLLGLTGSKYFPQGLVPAGKIIQSKSVMFGGEQLQGLSGINKYSLSVATLDQVDYAVEYAVSSKWNPEAELEHIEKLKDAMAGDWDKRRSDYNIAKKAIANGEKRLALWEKLNAEEKELVEEGFPVFFAIRPADMRLPEEYDFESGDLLSKFPKLSYFYNRQLEHAEYFLQKGASPQEITAVFVPADKVALVKDLLQGQPHIKVCKIEPILEASRRHGAVRDEARNKADKTVRDAYDSSRLSK